MSAILAKAMRDTLNRRGLSNRQAAKQMGISPATVGRILSGKDVETPTLQLVCHWMGVSISDIVEAEKPGVDGIAARLAVILSRYPDLALVTGRAIDAMLDGTMNEDEIRSIVRFIQFQLDHNRQDTDGPKG